MANYIKWIREKVGHDPIILNAAAAFVLNDQNQVLLLRRADRKEEVWGLPGGMMEIGESAEDTMKREVLEETGLIVNTEKFLGVYTKDRFDSYPNGDKAYVILFVFVCRVSSGALDANNEEAAELRYFDPDNFPPTFRHKQILKDYISNEKGIIR
ncbi:MAG: Phosphohydrolase (MutT/nudix family protein) [Candidatus Giovannonibacteria bacterium GW2011_GWA2_45_21]|uniref:Phosphohydrolase (MutT/nudix family protein) n=1 Tax=Candidatus Giovannonibacteria bacterium GW2011_GWA2_45_21 TaxID=1618649 RepID=A0A0G1M6H5_9BACT|nr:MAG: Phosphohydrolase (MutT/nudix family protein) [Candidatus Giovannonibacteria bacterium GW2011_GWA2_45_21]